MDLGLEGRVAIVGGASSGLGRAIAQELSQEGASVVLFARTDATLVDAATEISSTTGNPTHAVTADASLPSHLQAVVDETMDFFGRIDILVNNAGGPPLGKFDDFDDAAWQRAFDLSFMSTVRLTRLVAPHMRARHWGRILNVVSFTVRQPTQPLLLSNSIRMSVLGLTKSLATELAPDILINNLAPGRILTGRVAHMNEHNAERSGRTVAEVQAQATGEIPLGRYGQPEEFAALAAFLASDRASYITGQTFLCDGGLVSGV